MSDQIQRKIDPLPFSITEDDLDWWENVSQAQLRHTAATERKVNLVFMLIMLAFGLIATGIHAICYHKLEPMAYVIVLSIGIFIGSFMRVEV